VVILSPVQAANVKLEQNKLDTVNGDALQLGNNGSGVVVLPGSTKAVIHELQIQGNTISGVNSSTNMALTPHGDGVLHMPSNNLNLRNATVDNIAIYGNSIRSAVDNILLTPASASKLIMPNAKFDSITTNLTAMTIATDSIVSDSDLALTTSGNGKVDVRGRTNVGDLYVTSNTVGTKENSAINLQLAQNGNGVVTFSNRAVFGSVTAGLEVLSDSSYTSQIKARTSNGNINLIPLGDSSVKFHSGVKVGELTFQAISTGEGNSSRADTENIVLKAQGFGNVDMRGKVFVDNFQFIGGTITATNSTYENIVLKPFGDGTVQSPMDSQFGNLLFSGNTISEITTDGNILLTPNGTGKVGISRLNSAYVKTTKLLVDGTTFESALTDGNIEFTDLDATLNLDGTVTKRDEIDVAV
jgi:hypothetical protein